MSTPHFIFRVQRSDAQFPVYAVAFEVEEGTGRLRVARPGEYQRPPAAVSGEARKLTSAQLRASRFELIWDEGRRRRGFSLGQLGDAVLGQLLPGRWERLEAAADGPRQLVLSESPALFGLARVDPEPEPEDDRTPGGEADTEDETEERPEPVVQSLSGQPVLVRAERLGLEPADSVATTDPSRMVVDGPIGPGQSALVRHLRRKQARDAREIARLRAECRRLHEKLKDHGIPH